MPRVILHVGLHKTATSYLQNFVFPSIEENKVIYSPPLLMQKIYDCLKASEEELENKIQETLGYFNEISDGVSQTFFLSKEIMSGNLFTAYTDNNKYLNIVKRLFPEAEIVLFLRYQPDWLLSCYRESVHEHHYQSLSDFLNYKDKKFQRTNSTKNENGFANLNALDLDYSKLIMQYNELYGSGNVHIFFYEEFKKNKTETIKRMSNIIGSSLEIQKSNTISNRGYSAFGIKLSIIRFRLLKFFGLKSLLPEPIFFFGEGSVPARYVREKGTSFYHEDWRIAKQKQNPFKLVITFLYKLFFKFTWRYFIKKIVDKVYYFDWDLRNEKLKLKLDHHYCSLNQELNELMKDRQIPSVYISNKTKSQDS